MKEFYIIDAGKGVYTVRDEDSDWFIKEVFLYYPRREIIRTLKQKARAAFGVKKASFTFIKL